MLQKSLVFALDYFESTDTAANVDAHFFGAFGGNLQAGIGKGEIRRRDGELDESPHLLDLFFLDVERGVEPLHLSSDAAGKRRSVKLGDSGYAALRGL